MIQPFHCKTRQFLGVGFLINFETDVEVGPILDLDDKIKLFADEQKQQAVGRPFMISVIIDNDKQTKMSTGWRVYVNLT